MWHAVSDVHMLMSFHVPRVAKGSSWIKLIYHDLSMLFGFPCLHCLHCVTLKGHLRFYMFFTVPFSYSTSWKFVSLWYRVSWRTRKTWQSVLQSNADGSYWFLLLMPCWCPKSLCSPRLTHEDALLAFPKVTSGMSPGPLKLNRNFQETPWKTLKDSSTYLSIFKLHVEPFAQMTATSLAPNIFSRAACQHLFSVGTRGLTERPHTPSTFLNCFVMQIFKGGATTEHYSIWTARAIFFLQAPGKCTALKESGLIFGAWMSVVWHECNHIFGLPIGSKCNTIRNRQPHLKITETKYHKYI